MAMEARILATVPTPEPPWPTPTSAQPGQSVPQGERTGRRPQKKCWSRTQFNKHKMST